MPIMTDISAATIESRTIRDIYARLRSTRDSAERAELLRQAGQCADALGKHLRKLTEQTETLESDENVKAALSELSCLMEQVMVQEREYRMATGGQPEPAESSTCEERV